MKKVKISVAVFCICFSLAMVCSNAQAAGSVVSLKPGDSLQREFVLFDEFEFSKLSPAQVFLVIGTGDNASQSLLGELSITIKSYVPAEDFGTDIDFTLRGIALPLVTGAKPISISMISTVPVGSTFPATGVTKIVKFNSLYGFALVAIYISNFDGDTNGEPVRFSVTFGMAKKI
jgi:hypothetical protein